MDDESVVEVMTVLPGVVVLEELEPDDAEVPLGDGDVVVALERGDDAPDDVALDVEEGLFEDVASVGRLRVLAVVVETVDVWVVLVGITEAAAEAEEESAMLESVSMLRMTDIVLEPEVPSCAVVPISMELLELAPAVAPLRVSIVCVSVVTCIRVEGSMFGRGGLVSVKVPVYSLLVSVDWSCVDEEVVGIVIMVWSVSTLGSRCPESVVGSLPFWGQGRFRYSNWGNRECALLKAFEEGRVTM